METISAENHACKTNTVCSFCLNFMHMNPGFADPHTTQFSRPGPPFRKNINTSLQVIWVSNGIFFFTHSPNVPGIPQDIPPAKFQLEGPQSSIHRRPRTPASLWGSPSLRRAQHVLPGQGTRLGEVKALTTKKKKLNI